MSERNILNSPIEFGLRALIIISQLNNLGIDLDRLLIYDYLLTNSGEFNEALPSIHAETPYKYSKLLVKREVLKKGVNTFSKHGLLDVMLNKNGIRYKKNKFTNRFLNNIDSNYKNKLIRVAKWISSEVHGIHIEKIEKELQSRIKKYGVEFYSE